MRVLVTGIIAGMEDDQYIKDVINMGSTDGVPITYYNLVNELEKKGNKTLAKMLGSTNYLFEVLREREYATIGFELEKEQVENAIIRVPATIQWNHINYKLKDHKEIKQFINPDIIVTLIDAEWLIKNNLEKIKSTELFFQTIQKYNFGVNDILNWMNEEVSLSEDWAKSMGIPHFVIPIGQNPRSLYKLVKYENVPSFYVSYSMTHADKETRKEVDTAIKKLCKYGLVIDPQAIEIGHTFNTEEDKKVIYSYTVHRDLHWFVGKVESVVAIHPYTKRPPLSTGMMDELGHARDYLKKRYMIYPPEHYSPFTTDSYIEKGHIFVTQEELFLSLEAEGYKALY